jgi:hypothetical protein
LRMEGELAVNAMKCGVLALHPEIFLCADERFLLVELRVIVLYV